MNPVSLSVAGANTLLGQHLLARLARFTQFSVASLHDNISLQGIDSIADSPDWSVAPEIREAYRHVPLLPADAAAQAPLLASFLPDENAQQIESVHLARGTQVVTHCEYARLQQPLAIPGRLDELVGGDQHYATPNCTTAMCALPLQALQARFGIRAATITTLQAISGTDIPGMQAHTIHDQVVGHLPGEADALRNELRVIFSHRFPIDTFATRVPVWRGHTITLAVQLQQTVDLARIEDTLHSISGIHLMTPSSQMSLGRTLFHPNDPMVTIGALRVRKARDIPPETKAEGSSQASHGMTKGRTTIMMTLTGDNLEAATTGLMLATLQQLAIASQPSRA